MARVWLHTRKRNAHDTKAAREVTELGDHVAGGERPLRIGALAADAGINPTTIRYYEVIGLLPPPERTPSGYRVYSSEDRERLAFIRRAKQVGLSLQEISVLLDISKSGEVPCEHVLTLLDEKIEGTAEQIHALTACYRHLVELRTSARNFTRTELRRLGDEEACICSIIEVIDRRLVGRSDAPPHPHR